MNEIMINREEYADFDILLQEEGVKRVLWSVWNQLSDTKVDAVFAKRTSLKSSIDIKTIQIGQEEYNNRLEKTEGFAECLFNNSAAKKDFNTYVNTLVYKYTGGYSEIKDKLFHGILTKNCKAYACTQLNATCEGRIKTSDVERAKASVKEYLTPFEVNRLIQKSIDRWMGQIQKGSIGKTFDKSMLYKYIEQDDEKRSKSMEDKLNAI